jgi:hypothetical protein
MRPVRRALFRVVRHGPSMTLLGLGVLWATFKLAPYGVLPLGILVAMAIFLAPLVLGIKDLRDGR